MAAWARLALAASPPQLFTALCASLVAADAATTWSSWSSLWLMNRNDRRAGKANHRKRAVSHVRRKAKRPRKGVPTVSRRGLNR